LRLRLSDIPGMKVTVMGLGLHGGGGATARFFSLLGARVLVTDLRSEEELRPSLVALKDLKIRYRLGEHRREDFRDADLVVKNPAVPLSSPYLRAARTLTNDIAVFLALSRREVFALTGTKGKSTTASAVHHVLKRVKPGTDLGGNITVSPLTFLLGGIDGGRLVEPDAPVVLELSSWQLADCLPREVLKPHWAMITNIMHDHQNRYNAFEEYVNDKRLIFSGQSEGDFSIFNYDDPYGRRFASEASGRVRMFSASPLPTGLRGGYLDGAAGILRRSGGKEEQALPDSLKLPGKHNRLNMLAAAVMLDAAGIDTHAIREGLADFPGIPHRLEEVAEIDGVRYYNDSAATIPQATSAALASFSEPVHLIAGGNDKELDFTGLSESLKDTAGVYLLEGSATARFAEAVAEAGQRPEGPFDSLSKAVEKAAGAALPGEVVLLSPGCTSFGMFKNEFHRGDQFRELVLERGRGSAR
jgi:UDP-N-acetylmuramoylalanine--D-glutamate ligase